MLSEPRGLPRQTYRSNEGLVQIEPGPGLTIGFFKKDSFNPALEYRDGGK